MYIIVELVYLYHRQTNKEFGQLLKATRRAPTSSRRGECEGDECSIRVKVQSTKMV
jgi:hypothetical protein